jgi:hypothetical protein
MCQDRIEIKRAKWLGLLMPVIMAVMLTGCGGRLEAAQTHSTERHAGEIRGGRTVGQTFVAQRDGLHAVDVLMATFDRQNTHPVVFHLRENPDSNDDLRTVTVAASDIVDNAYHRFSFPPIPDSHHRRFYFFIESPASQPGDAVTAWIGPPSSYQNGSLYLEGQAEEGQLAFQLSYKYTHIGLGLVRDLLFSIPAGLATTALFVLPGLALFMWLAPIWHWDMTLTAVVAAGTSAALFPLLLLVTWKLGLRWNMLLVWAFLTLCAGFVLWRLQRLFKSDQLHWSGWRALLKRPATETVLFWVIAAMVLGVRWFVVRPLTVPLWGDSVQHSYIAQLIVDNGGLFDSWAPYSPHNSLTVHFGFHASAAFFHWATGIGVLRSVILVGQVFNGLAVLALYPLAVRISGNRWAGVGAVLAAGLLMLMPMKYVDWGRYPQLAGQAILLVALWLLWIMADHQGKGGWRLAILAAIAAAGMALTYYRMPFYYAVFLLPWLLLYGVMELRGDKARWVTLIKRLVLMGLALLALLIPWSANLMGGQLAEWLVDDASVTSSLDRVLEEYREWRHIDGYVPPFLQLLSLIAIVWSLVKRRWTVILVGLWALGLALLVAAQLTPLPGGGFQNSFSVMIALYMPVGLLVGWLACELMVLASNRGFAWANAVAVLVLVAVALFGVRERMTVVDPAFRLVDLADEVAMDWIREATPSDAVFLVNGFTVHGGRSVVGSDAGWWIPLLAGRKNTMPPQYALYNEEEAIPGYGQSVVQLVHTLDDYAPTTDAGLDALCRFGVTHVYIGQGQGQVALNKLTPYLVPADLLASPDFDLLYHQDRVWIFGVKSDSCS